MTIIFFGSDPWFSPPILEALTGAGHKILAVVTKGETSGRLPIFIQAKSSDDISVSRFTAYGLLDRPDLIVLAAFGPPFLTSELLRWPKYGSLNVHASLLPRWRGASPVFAAIAGGDKKTGVTIMRMTEKVDLGPILGQMARPIRQPSLSTPRGRSSRGPSSLESFDNRETLTRKLAELGGKLIVETIEKIENDHVEEVRQPAESPTSYTRRLTKDSGQIDWTKTPEETERFIRAVTPWPGAWTEIQEQGQTTKIQKLKILTAHLEPLSSLSPHHLALTPSLVQLPGKNPVTWKQFIAGHQTAKFVSGWAGKPK